jgi:polysaccharide deacetylase family protein (PEP-CTERM system associated)
MSYDITRKSSSALFRGIAMSEPPVREVRGASAVSDGGIDTLRLENGRIRPVRTTGVVPRCSLTVDVEDWYQSSVDYDAPITTRVVRNMATLRELLHDCGVKATFFVQGRVAETFPRLLQDLLAEGHEIQSHGYSHRPLFQMDRKALRAELELGRKTVEDACGVKVTAFRAPDFSIVRDNLWALEVLAETGFEVDSSIFPMAMKRYGIGEWQTSPSRIQLANGAMILEAPVAVWSLGRFRAPVAGGGYFRLLPHQVLEGSIRSILASGRPAIIYCHPYEFNPRELDDYRGQISPLFRMYQGLGRGAFAPRVRHLLTALPFGRMDDVLKAWEDQ